MAALRASAPVPDPLLAHPARPTTSAAVAPTSSGTHPTSESRVRASAFHERTMRLPSPPHSLLKCCNWLHPVSDVGVISAKRPACPPKEVTASLRRVSVISPGA
jgi:hypothetical protein